MSGSNDINELKPPVGASVYSRRSLRVYDFVVHFLSNRMVWRCPVQHLINHSRQFLSDNHLEIGVGSGKLFRKTAKGKVFERLVIADVNQDCLDVSAKTLRDSSPSIWKLDLLSPQFKSESPANFQSIGLNYVLHCLPLSLAEKSRLCQQLVSRCLAPGGVLFGSTLMQDLNSSFLSKRLMKFYNRKKIFNNKDETLTAFEQQLSQLDLDFELYSKGCVCLFRIQSK